MELMYTFVLDRHRNDTEIFSSVCGKFEHTIKRFHLSQPKNRPFVALSFLIKVELCCDYSYWLKGCGCRKGEKNTFSVSLVMNSYQIYLDILTYFVWVEKLKRNQQSLVRGRRHTDTNTIRYSIFAKALVYRINIFALWISFGKWMKNVQYNETENAKTEHEGDDNATKPTHFKIKSRSNPNIKHFDKIYSH